MSAYPFPPGQPRITFRQFAELIDQSEQVTVARIANPDSGNEALYRFTRTIDDAVLADVIEYVEDDSWPMMPTTFRSLCVRLGLDPDVIGGSRH